METIILAFAKYVEIKGVDFTSQVFMVKEHSRYVAKVFSVNFLLLSVEFKHTHFVVSVDLVTWRTPDCAPC